MLTVIGLVVTLVLSLMLLNFYMKLGFMGYILAQPLFESIGSIVLALLEAVANMGQDS